MHSVEYVKMYVRISMYLYLYENVIQICYKNKKKYREEVGTYFGGRNYFLRNLIWDFLEVFIFFDPQKLYLDTIKYKIIENVFPG